MAYLSAWRISSSAGMAHGAGHIRSVARFGERRYLSQKAANNMLARIDDM